MSCFSQSANAWKTFVIAISALPVAHGADSRGIVGEPVVVIAPRLDESAVRYVIGAKIITSQDIERNGAATLSDLLRSAPQLLTRDLAGSPNTQIDLRGFGSFGDQNTLVLVDGMRMREYEMLTANWSSIPLSSIERIEILPAGGGVLFGGGATGGTINIVTKIPPRNVREAELAVGAGSYDTRQLRASANITGETAGLRFYGSRYDTDGYRDNNRVRIDNARAEWHWTGSTSSLALKFGMDKQRNGLPGVLSEASMAMNRRQASSLYDVAMQDGSHVNLVSQTAFRGGDFSLNLAYRERDTSTSSRAGTPLFNVVDTHMRLWTFAPRLRIRPALGGTADNLIVGADVEHWTFDGDGRPLIVSRPHSTQRTAGYYAQYATHLAKASTLSLGVREQRASYAVVNAVAPADSNTRRLSLRAWELAARHAFNRGGNVFVRKGGNFRLPNVNDNFNPFLARVTLLEPQRARDAELGIEGSMGSARYRASVFRIDIDNEIFFDPVTLGSRNRRPTRRQGLQLDGSWQVGANLLLRGNYVHADGKFREGVVAGRPIAGNPAPLVPRHTLTASLRYLLPRNAHADVDVRHTGESSFDNDDTNTFGRRIPAYTLVDFKLTLRGRDWQIDGGVRNLFGRKYFSYGVVAGPTTFLAIPDPERTVFVTAQYQFR